MIGTGSRSRRTVRCERMLPTPALRETQSSNEAASYGVLELGCRHSYAHTPNRPEACTVSEYSCRAGPKSGRRSRHSVHPDDRAVTRAPLEGVAVREMPTAPEQHQGRRETLSDDQRLRRWRVDGHEFHRAIHRDVQRVAQRLAGRIERRDDSPSQAGQGGSQQFFSLESHPDGHRHDAARRHPQVTHLDEVRVLVRPNLKSDAALESEVVRAELK